MSNEVRSYLVENLQPQFASQFSTSSVMLSKYYSLKWTSDLCWPQPAMNNEIRDGRPNWLAITAMVLPILPCHNFFFLPFKVAEPI